MLGSVVAQGLVAGPRANARPASARAPVSPSHFTQRASPSQRLSAAGYSVASRRQQRRAIRVSAETRESGADVYAVSPEPPAMLKEGMRRHTISVFVGDETGMINRVAGVFARRAYNIESLAVGLNIDKALFTVVVIGTDVDVDMLIKQIYKLPNVIKVEDLTYTPCVERGLVLIKVAAGAEQRGEVLDLAGIFRANAIDVSDKSITLAVTGDPGKTRAFQRTINKFGVLSVARTGKLALKRERAYNEERRSRMIAMLAQRAASAEAQQKEAAAASPASSAAAPALPASGSSGMDVYKQEAGDSVGVWDFPVLRPYWSDDTGLAAGTRATKTAQYKPHTLSILVENLPGVLDRVTGVIARRGYNVQSLGVGPEKSADVSRMTIVVPGTDGEVEKLLKQLVKLNSVLEAVDLSKSPFVQRELMLIKVAADKSLRSEITDLALVFRAKVCDISSDTLTVEAIGTQDKLAQLQDLLEPYGVLEVARSGIVALPRDSGVNTLFLEEVEDDREFYQ